MNEDLISTLLMLYLLIGGGLAMVAWLVAMGHFLITKQRKRSVDPQDGIAPTNVEMHVLKWTLAALAIVPGWPVAAYWIAQGLLAQRNREKA